MVEVVLLYFAAVDGVLADFLSDETAGGEVDEAVVCGYLFAESGAAAEGGAHDEDLGSSARGGLDGLDGEGLLSELGGTWSSCSTNCSWRLWERSISQYCW